ncbi:hypothetical protein E2C01_055196 [Portunus trituberculatus]|uniref:Uncharacterized protein n=1 Tax=Portunus trituberculatus TaxID=210409 RepID=A0A5B7GQJ4_PORTR|nr:hypothetical protein [Portunus trituberculatus]
MYAQILSGEKERLNRNGSGVDLAFSYLLREDIEISITPHHTRTYPATHAPSILSPHHCTFTIVLLHHHTTATVSPSIISSRGRAQVRSGGRQVAWVGQGGSSYLPRVPQKSRRCEGHRPSLGNFTR